MKNQDELVKDTQVNQIDFFSESGECLLMS